MNARVRMAIAAVLIASAAGCGGFVRVDEAASILRQAQFRFDMHEQLPTDARHANSRQP